MRLSRDRAPTHASQAPAAVGFTLIELMVVIGIIVLAAGLMTPTIADFFKNRQLETIRGHIGSAFNKARLDAVTRGVRASMVFFREGVRVYLEKEKRFDEDDLFSPETSPLADDSVWYVLGFLGKKTNFDLESYRGWETRQQALSEAEETGRKPGESTKGQVDVSGLPKITFERDGSLTFVTGSKVPSSELKKEIPDTADIAIFSSMSNTGCFIELRLPGQMRSRMVPLKEIPVRPKGEASSVEAKFELEPDGSEAVRARSFESAPKEAESGADGDAKSGDAKSDDSSSPDSTSGDSKSDDSSSDDSNSPSDAKGEAGDSGSEQK